MSKLKMRPDFAYRFKLIQEKIHENEETTMNFILMCAENRIKNIMNKTKTVITGNYSPIVDRNSISKLKCPICEIEIGIGKDFVVTPDKTIYHFDCYLSQLEEHERR